MIIRKVRRGILRSYEVGYAREREIEVIGAINHIVNVLHRSEAARGIERTVERFAQLVTAVQIKTGRMSRPDIEDHRRNETVHFVFMPLDVGLRTEHPLLF